MNDSVLIAPSILSADFSCLADQVALAAEGGADILHVDVMDGRFVPNITIGPLVVEALKRATNMPLDVHLMIDNPENYVDRFIEAGAGWLSFHVEATNHVHRVVQQIKEYPGVKAGVALNPATPVTYIQHILEDLDFVVIMSVNPGFGGQKFIPSALDKIQVVRHMIDSKGLNTLIQVDGGVSADNADKVVLKGAEVLVAGSAVFGAKDIPEAVRKIRKAASI
ncbi:MAG: ribulose-phosphate 3-epimerase [Rubrobacteridae bacterium]|nr:ribulose-phosphate 3-epimerase [Rubrobacteridae bacterium]